MSSLASLVGHMASEESATENNRQVQYWSLITHTPTKLGCALGVELPVPLVGEDAGLAETRVDPALLGQHSGEEEQEQRHHPLHDGLSSASLTISSIS